ncbi:aminotransferase class V-fold PLP-dependent enzyme [Pseudoflavonifractor phocaeensis]|uniref:aminotransferase class V-fold PLP-dependent enzyme n=1 Tax=Pseudoflavonifractor phocaeensis TaxID=1870988 RepID=UPI00195E5F38|nr:aminotransferase class V-fold PLP-dependent enzyme [Pseudoflavonifractor phocaeensis]MBM6869585.1 aminotransferase class V-fold PLP-dependent enzyme [Pseudoflavonifractor phocaeensis]
MIYLDCAATTLQKPPAVVRAAAWAVGRLATPGRGGHPAAAQAAALAFRCREEAAALFGVADPERVIFTANATHALNIAIRSLVPPGGRVVLSGWEHNAVTRPLAALDAKVRIAATPLFRPQAALDAFRAAVEPGVDAVICTHVSNVFGYTLPVADIAALCRQRGVPLIVDAAQSAGCLPLDLDGWGAAFIAMPGHKGLYGPQGTGLLLCGRQVRTAPLLYGGTGSASASPEMPPFLPDRLEAGTHNMPGIAGLLQGLRFVRCMGTGRILAHEQRLTAQAAGGLKRLSGVRVFSGPAQTGVLSFQIAGVDCEEAAARLGQMGIAVRAGLHCAPMAHESGGTFEEGTVRASFSAFNTQGEAARLVRCVARLTGR